MGLTRVASGPLALDRVDLGARPPHLRARLGIGYVSEGRRLISALSAREDIRVPAWAASLVDLEARLDVRNTLMLKRGALASRRR
jgi:ABC-type branched-subunit amino acid transport system ATPase component